MSVAAWLDEHRSDFVDELLAWVRIPSIVGPAEHAIDVTRSAQWLAGTLREIGFPTVELWRADTGPAVFAEWRTDPGAPTVLVYSHHDVRAVKDEQWEQCAPFDPVLREGRVYGRGASDAKGQVLAHLWGLRALLAEADAPPVNLLLFVEGEEEAGSPNLVQLLDDYGGRLAADLIVFSDTMTWSATQPALCTGVRGLVKMRLELHGPDTDIHAGAVSGVTPNPATELVRVLAGLHDAEGRIAIPGFYDDVAPVSDDERAAIAALTADEDEWIARTHTRAVHGETDRSVGERLWLRPSAEVGTLIAGDPIGPSRGAIPATAGADIQFSMVPDQDPARISEIVGTWIAAQVPDHVAYTLQVGELERQRPYATPPDHPALPALEAALAEAWDAPVGRMRNAGSGPAALLAERLGAPVVFFGTGLPEDRWHGPDESADLDVLLKGAATMASFWPRLATALRRS